MLLLGKIDSTSKYLLPDFHILKFGSTDVQHGPQWLDRNTGVVGVWCAGYGA